MISLKYKNSGFTLIEVIITVVIIAILSTIGVMSYFGYSSDARDSVRMEDMGNVKVGLKLIRQAKNSYPYPDLYFTIVNSGTTQDQVFQGILSNKIAIDGLSEIPKDPKNKVEYGYSISRNRLFFQLAATLENNDKPMAYLDGDYKTVTKNMFPSMFLALSGTGKVEISNSTAEGTINRKKFLVNKGSLNLLYDFDNNLPLNKATNFDSILIEDGISLGGASDYANCEEIYEAGKFMGGGEYQIMTETGQIINTICGDAGSEYVEPTINENTNLYTLSDSDLKLSIEDNTGNILTENWAINGCDSMNMTINTTTFLGGNQSLSSIDLSPNTFYKVPAGNYILTGSTVTNGHINFNGNCIGLIGEGTGSAIFTPAFIAGGTNGDGAGTNEAGIIGVRGNKQNIIISGISIANNATDPNRYDHSIYIDGNSSNITIKDVKVSGAAKYGICLDYYNDNNYIYNAESSNNGWYGIGVIFHSKNNIVNNIKTYGNILGGLMIDNLVYNNYFENVISYGNSGNGINITASSSGNTLSGALIYNNVGNGIKIESSTYNTINNVKTYSNTGNGLFTITNSSYNKFNNIDSFFNLGANGGLAFDTSTYNYLSGIKSYLNSGDGITFDTSSNYNSGTNIDTYSNTRFGLNIYTSSGILLENINSYSNTGAGIVIDSSRNNILNKFNSYSNTAEGISIERASNSLDYNKISNGNIYNNGTLGINLYSSLGNFFNNISVFNNNISNTNYLGMITLDNASGTNGYNSFNNISVFNNNMDGLLLNPNNDFNIFNNMIVYSNLGGGLYIEAGSINNTFNDFKTYNNNYGVLDYANVITNKYYGTFNYFSISGWNDNITYLKQGTGSTIGFIDGTMSTVGSMDCSWHSGPNLTSWGSTCTDKGSKTSGLTMPVTTYNFGTNIPKQKRPVIWNGTSWELYGTGGIDYDTNKYIGQW